MALIPAPLDYTSKDFEAMRDRLIALVRSVFPDWTDFNVANFGNILLELNAHIFDVIGFYQDAQARESRWGTATQRASLLALVKLIGYEPSTAAAATVDVTLTIKDAATDAAPIGDATIPAGTIIKTKEVTDPIEFRLLSDATVLAGVSPSTSTVSAKNSKTESEQFTSTEQPNQEFKLSSVPYLDDSATITAADGTYTEVDNFLDSDSTSKHFTLIVDQNDQAKIRFGNGVSGKIPLGTITVDYETGGGADGNVEQNSLELIPGHFTDSLGNTLSVSVTNAAKAAGGRGRESTAEIQINAPLSNQVQGRAVSRVDFEISANKVSGVARTLMLTSNQDASIPENTGFLYVVPEGGGTPSSAILQAVEDRFDEEDGETPHTLTFTLNVTEAVYLELNIQATIFVAYGYSPASVATQVRANLADYFAITTTDDEGNEIPNPEIDFGFYYKDADGNPEGELPLSDIYNVVRDTEGVRKMGDRIQDFMINDEHEDAAILVRQFPKLGTVTLIDGDTGATL